MNARVALVTTARTSPALLTSFLRHHERIGIQRIYLFLDDASAACSEAAGAFGLVRLTSRDNTLHARYQTLPQFPHYADHVEDEVMSRQCLNASLAVEAATEEGLDWLVHVDVDELLWLPEGASTWFGALPPDVGQVIFPNEEGIPEQHESCNYFRTVTLFRRNPATVSPEQISDYLARTGREDFFLGYDVGKAAVRLHPGAAPRGVHRFFVPPATPRSLTPDDARVLHYIDCSRADYVEKYRVLGAFSDLWWNKVPIGVPFHLESRNALQKEGETGLHRLFDHSILHADLEVITALLREGVLVRRTDVARGLA